MNKKLLQSALAGIALLSLASCFNDTTTYDYQEDVSITGFSLSAVNKYYTVKSSAGADSTVKKALTASSYKFIIDQNNRQIYNTDSLPKGTDPKHILCSVTATYAGAVVVKHISNDSLDTFSTSDSLDFSSPRKFIVYNASYNAARTYTISVNVHNEDSTTMTWNQMYVDTKIAELTAMRAVTLNNKIYIFGNKDSEPAVFAQNTDNSFSKLATNVSLDANAYKNAIVKDSKIYILSGNKVMASADGKTWTVIGDGSGLKQLVAAGRNKLFALTATGFSSSTDGVTWTAGNIDSNVSNLPYQDIAFATRPATVNSDVDQITVIGNRNPSVYSADTTATTWAHIDDFEQGAEIQPWMLNVTQKDSVGLPSMSNLQAINYGDSIIVLGGKALASYKGTAFANFYYSGDGGINWHKSYYVTLPTKMKSSETNFAMTRDDNNYIWIICGTTGEIWRGRVAYLGWTKNQEVFK
jgi:hypothetical protein